MLDKKSIAAVIKTLDRVIGMLENSNDLGEFSEITRKRIIEMLNTTTMDVYFIGSTSGTVQTGDRVSHKNEIEKTSNEIQKTSNEIPKTTNEVQKPVVEEVQINITENGKFISDEDIENAKKEETRQAKPVQNQIVPEQFVTEQIIREVVRKEPEREKIIPEPAKPTVVDEPVYSRQPVTTPTNPVIEHKKEEPVYEPPVRQPLVEYSDKPLFDWESEETIKAKNELELLRNQLDDEKKRLERELQSWQEEKRKKEEEMLAAKKLLEALQQRQQQMNASSSQPQSNWRDEPIIRETVVNKPTEKTEPRPKPQETLINNTVAPKKVLYENFETNDFVNQISTPISNLSRAIGINDKFRFIKELFGGDSDKYSDTIEKLDKIGSLGSAISYIESLFSWDKNSDSVKQFISLIRRRYM